MGANMVNLRSFRVDVRVIARQRGGWAYKGNAVVVKMTPVCAGNESPEVVDTIDMVVDGLEKDRQDGVRETEEIVVGGLSING